MPIEVVDSDGTVIEFPDGTPQRDIAGVMRRRDQERDARTRSGDPRQPGSVAGAVAGRGAFTAAPQRGERRRPLEEVAGALTNVTRGVPFYQDAVAGLTGLGEAAQGRDFGQGYQRSIEEQRGRAQDFRARRPLAANFAEGTGAALPILASGGATAAPQLAGRGLGLFARQTALAGATGAGAGFAYGAGAGDAPGLPLQERLNRGMEGAGMGAALGVVTPAAVNAVSAGINATRPAWQALANPRPIATRAAESGAGMFGGQAFQGGRRPPLPRTGAPAPPPIDPASIGTIDRLLDRSGQNVAQLEQRLSRARANPQGEVLADVFDDPGVRTMRAIAQGPGQTGQRAAEVARERFQAAPDRILNEFNTRLAVAETPEQALRSLSQQYDEASAALYKPVFEARLTPEARTAIDGALSRYARDPVFRDATARANRIFERDAANGLVDGSIDDNYARYLHYLKMGLDDASRFSGTPQGGVMGTELRGVREMRRRVIDTIDAHIPGYREARNRWSTISNAEEALDEGRTLINQNANSIQARMGELTDFERYHARVGFANEIANRIGLRGSVNGNRNVAEALGSPEMQRRVAAMFETPEEAAAFLDTLNQQNMLMRNAGQWGSGSQTFSNATHALDQGINAAADMGVQAATGNVAGVVRGGLNSVANAATLGAIERRNNQVGQTLLRRIDNAEAADFSRAVIAELRRREAQRAARTTASQSGAAAAGAQQRPQGQ